MCSSDLLATGGDRVLLVTEEAYHTLESRLPPGTTVVARRRPLFKDGDFMILSRDASTTPLGAAPGSTLR